MELVGVTKHAKRRIKERMGLPRSACQRMAEKAYFEGKDENEFVGKLQACIKTKLARNKNRNSCNQIRIYGQFIYMFSDAALITVLRLPKLPINITRFV